MKRRAGELVRRTLDMRISGAQVCFVVFVVAHAAQAGINTWTIPAGAGIRALAIDPITPTTIYAGGYGVFKSTDGGATWNAASRDVVPTVGVNVLAIDPSTPSTLYAGLDNDGTGVFKSVDGGATWSQLHAPGYAFLIDSGTPTTIYAGGCGVFKSTDGGATWRTSSQPAFVDALAIDPITPTTLYAGTNGAGVFKSTDGGTTWTALNAGLPDTAVVALAIDPRTPSTIYAGLASVEYPAYTIFGVVVKSIDGGATWTPFSPGLALGGDLLAIAPTNPTTVYAAAAGTLFAIQSVDVCAGSNPIHSMGFLSRKGAGGTMRLRLPPLAGPRCP